MQNDQTLLSRTNGNIEYNQLGSKYSGSQATVKKLNNATLGELQSVFFVAAITSVTINAEREKNFYFKKVHALHGQEESTFAIIIGIVGNFRSS
ncbi:predicted protein [Methanosarcina acetivorans C2A]|uniref:Uncharacterized protein n=1 Tax=Methanosarcina acetivorans (strain ATCC 35395 / DSM 2834 / JCM 12185 / C2A) TaxID=188937 RepID=Q8TKD4_METAC|nr:predicted protein [Methanosarcina acetivorans C2A]